ncbi:unnamed protein product [Paramecium octaurelia]|uniref:Uncharacterized protein n=1 Tax=Paramecium octaurelia TaxID=43137 RepID=A0A8S1YDN3_PAROT|nr:unnamed protein product [Paramecium octaurelia]
MLTPQFIAQGDTAQAVLLISQIWLKKGQISIMGVISRIEVCNQPYSHILDG